MIVTPTLADLAAATKSPWRWIGGRAESRLNDGRWISLGLTPWGWACYIPGGVQWYGSTWLEAIRNCLDGENERTR